MDWTIVLSILAGALAIYYYSSRKKSNDFQQHGIPHVERPSLFKRLWKIFVFPRSFAQLVQEMYNLHSEAKYIGAFDFTRLIVIIRDPELIKSVAIKNFDAFEDHIFFNSDNQDPLFGKNLMALRGDRWRDVRALLSPAFTSSKMKAMFQLMSECAINFSDYLMNVPSEKRIMEMKDIFSRYTIDVIATCAFGISIDSMRNPKNDFYTYGKKAADFNTLALIKILMYQNVPRLMRLLNLKMLDDHTNAFFMNLVADSIKFRDEKGITRPDILQLLMDSRDKREPEKELTIVDMTSQAFIFFLGGFDSSSTLLSLAAYEIAVNPKVQERLQNEIDKVLEDTNDQPSYEAINGMAYLNAVINEALRMHPVAPMTDRLCVKDFELPAAVPDAKPYLVKKGTVLWIPLYGLQHDAKYFPEPNKFKPERFLENKEDQCNLNAYYPFGLGPRVCIGNRFALLEIRIALFHLLARCDLKPCEKTPIPLKLKKGGFSTRVEGGCWLNVVPRKNGYSNITSAKQQH